MGSRLVWEELSALGVTSWEVCHEKSKQASSRQTRISSSADSSNHCREV
jgi:hypothetical protein